MQGSFSSDGKYKYKKKIRTQILKIHRITIAAQQVQQIFGKLACFTGKKGSARTPLLQIQIPANEPKKAT